LANLTVNGITAGGTSTTVNAITDSALTTINVTTAGGPVSIGAGTALSQAGLAVTDGSATVAGVALTFNASASSSGDTITIGSATANNNNINNIAAAGATTTITIDGTGNNIIVANGTGDIITVGDATNGVGANAITAQGAGDTVTFLGTQAGGTSTVLVGSNAVITFGTTTGAGSEQIQVTNATTGATASGTFAFTTLNAAVDSGTGHQQILFGTVGTTHEGLAGASVEASLVNVASVTTLAGALNLAASQAAIAVQPNPNLPGFAQLQPGDGVIDWFQFQGNTYIVEATNPGATAASHAALAATDVVVKIAGLVDIGANGTFTPGTHILTL
jgi:hypothetical protein